MKIVIQWACTLCIMLTTHQSFAQNQHELSLGYARGSRLELEGTFLRIQGYSAPTADLLPSNQIYSGLIYGSYRYLHNNTIAFGGMIGYEHLTAEESDVKSYEIPGSIVGNYFVFAAEVDFRYVRKPNFTMYSGVGLGAFLYFEHYTAPDSDRKDDSSRTGMLDLQITAVGFKFGNRYGAFTELGYGYKGIARVGIFSKL